MELYPSDLQFVLFSLRGSGTIYLCPTLVVQIVQDSKDIKPIRSNKTIKASLSSLEKTSVSENTATFRQRMPL